MIGLQLRVNNTLMLLNVQCVRVAPRGDIQEGDDCTYLTKIHNQNAGTIHHPYGDSVGLAHKMLDFYAKFSEERVEEFRIAGIRKQVQGIIDEDERSKSDG